MILKIYAYLKNLNENIHYSCDYLRYVKYMGDGSKYICIIQPINENNLDLGFIFELNEIGHTRFQELGNLLLVGKYKKII